MRFRNRRVQDIARVVVANRMLRNMRRNRLRAVHSISYEAEDMSEELYNHLSDMEILSDIVNATLDDIMKLKEEFSREFQGVVPGYEEVEEKLDQLEKSILTTKKRLEVSQNNLHKNIELNERKLVRVKELNQSAA